MRLSAHPTRRCPLTVLPQEFLTWKKPGNLTRRQSVELDVDLNERFYHDYFHGRSGGWGGGGAGRCTVRVVRRCVLLFLPLEQMEMLVRT